MKFDIVTIFPRMVEALLREGILARSIARGVIDVSIYDLREYTDDAHRTVDDAPFGGGPGMVLKPEPFLRAVDRITTERGQPSVVVATTPQGRLFEDGEARWLSRLDHVTVLCGRYEGIDERVHQLLSTHEISIGDYVLSGGEIPALAILDAVARLLPGAVGDTKSVEQDSFAEGLLDHPHYTRPAAVRGLEVPEVLRSGHHQEIERWRRREALKRTLERRPDLLTRASLNAEDRRVLEDLQESD